MTLSGEGMSGLAEHANITKLLALQLHYLASGGGRAGVDGHWAGLALRTGAGLGDGGGVREGQGGDGWGKTLQLSNVSAIENLLPCTGDHLAVGEGGVGLGKVLSFVGLGEQVDRHLGGGHLVRPP